MANGFQRLKAQLRSVGLVVEGNISDAWGSNSPGSRLEIRNNILLTLKPLNSEEEINILNLSQRPKTNLWSVSVSHTEQTGGWIAAQPYALLGFDIETRARLSESIIKRISTREEIALAPFPEVLWPAKEAAFKSLPTSHQPPTITKLRTANWVSLAENLYHYDCPTFGHGWLAAEDTYFFSAFLSTVTVSK